MAAEQVQDQGGELTRGGRVTTVAAATTVQQSAGGVGVQIVGAGSVAANLTFSLVP